MPIPLIPIIGAAIAGGAIGVCITRIKDSQDGSLYHEDGYNNLGFDRNGFDREGFDKTGFDKEGYNRKGFDKNGFDREGFDKEGFDLKGFNKDGRNRKGYNRTGWNELGRDVTGHDPAYYGACAAEVKERLAKANEFIASEDYEHASLEIRKGAELVVNCIISHTLGIGRYKRHFETDINSCRGALDDEMIGKLQNLRRTCSDQLHIEVRDVENLQIDSKYVENLKNNLQFCENTLEEALGIIEGYASGQ